MNPNAQKWVDALRSGNYSQTRGQLRYNQGYCCHGVACDLFADEVQGEWRGDHFYRKESTVVYDTMPPNAVTELLEINSRFAERLAFANDNGESFSEIADIIEDYFHE